MKVPWQVSGGHGMRRTITKFGLAIALLVGGGGVCFAQNFAAGQTAYNKGDYTTAFREWSVLAEKGDAWAQFYLGFMYYNGRGVTQDYREAVRWYRLSAEQGNAEAQFTMAIAYFTGGFGLKQSDREAVKWFRMGAEQGNKQAQFGLATMYYNGLGVSQEYVYAHMWWNIGASNGDTVAAKQRDVVAIKMTNEQITQAQQLARQCVAKKYKRC